MNFALSLMPMVFLLLLQDLVAGQSTSYVDSFQGYYISGTASTSRIALPPEAIGITGAD